MRIAILGCAALSTSIAFAGTVSFERDVKPIFAKRCAACHFPEADALKAKLDLSTAASALVGSEEGKIIEPGNADASKLVKLIEWREQPEMPPKKNNEKLPQSEIDLIRTWIAEGARADETAPAAPAPVLPPAASATSAHPAAVSALAFSPDGTMLARGGLHAVALYRTAEGKEPESLGVLPDHADLVRALAFSPDGAFLAAAGGKPGRGGEVKVWKTADHSLALAIAGHNDNIFGVAFSPDGTQIATCSYDKLIKLWDAKSGAELRTLKDHVDAVYSIAFSPDGNYLVSGGGDRTVKVWEAKSGKRLVTFSDASDAIYAVACAPDGKHIAGAGADKMIRIWDLEASLKDFSETKTSTGVVARSTFAHDGAVLNLIYAADGATLYSAGEDKRVKAWNTETMRERASFEAQPDSIMALALNPKSPWLAVGRFDATAAVYHAGEGKPIWRADGTGKLARAEMPAGERKKITNVNVEGIFVDATIPASIASIDPPLATRGAEMEVTVTGKNLKDATPFFADAGIEVKLISNEALPVPEFKYNAARTDAQLYDKAVPHRLKLHVHVKDDAVFGPHYLMADTPLGLADAAEFKVISKADTPETEPNDTPERAQAIDAWPVTIAGAMNVSGDTDSYRVHLATGKELVCVLTESGLSASLRIRDGQGKVLADSADFHHGMDTLAGFRAPVDGDYVVEIADRDLKAGVSYRLHVGEFPYARTWFPLGVAAGASATIHVEGFNLGANEIAVKPPDTAKPWSRMPLTLPAFPENPIAAPVLAVAPYAAANEVEPNGEAAQAQLLAVRTAIDGRIDSAGDADLYRVRAAKGDKLVFEIVAARVGSRVDSLIEVLDAKGEPLKRAQARCVAQTFMTLSDRDSRSAGLRIENWSSMHMRDYLMVGAEIVQVSTLPDYADEDIALRAYTGGQRVGYFGTTPEFHAVNTPVYRVEMHPPDETLAANGMPVFPIFWRNDDHFFEGENQGDSYLEFEAPAEGDFLVRVSDLSGGSGAEHAYRVMLRTLEPDFEVRIDPYRVNVAEGGRVPLDVRVRRRDGFDAPVRVSLEGLPQGLSFEGGTLLPEEETLRVGLAAAPGAASTAFGATFKLLATAELGGAQLTREGVMGDITVVRHTPDVTVKQEGGELAIQPGGKARLAVHIDRANGFSSRVPIDVLNLPYGVRVLDTGLNGILVRDGEYDRNVEIYAEPWAAPMTRNIYVQARIESPSPGRMIFLGQPIVLRVDAAGDAPKIAKKD